ncbi:MAG TPA: putative porin, partial [Flavisolibacter sp.]
MKRYTLHSIISVLFLALLVFDSSAQEPVIRPGNVRRPTRTTPNTTSPNAAQNPQGNQIRRGDTTLSNVERRDYSDDSLQVQVYTLTTTKPVILDTSIRDFTTRFPIPATHVFLGNDGSATRSLLFSMPARIGFDPGFHSHDVYKWKLENIRFYNTQRPYTELGYMIGARQEQMIDILHTQNIRPYWNASFQYRTLSAPGIFRNQKNNHTNYAFTSWYQSPNKRYNNYLVLLNNKIQAGESGGIRTDKNYLTDPVYERSRFTIPTVIGGDPTFGADPFSNALVTGRREKEFNFLLRQQYDLGRKDSLVTDSTVIPLFYPRLRFEHTFKYGNYDYFFQDQPSNGRVNNYPDSAYYDRNYGINFSPRDTIVDTVFVQDRWKEISNDFSIYQYPDANNLQQYIKLGIELQLIKGRLAKSNP